MQEAFAPAAGRSRLWAARGTRRRKKFSAVLHGTVQKDPPCADRQDGSFLACFYWALVRSMETTTRRLGSVPVEWVVTRG